MGYSRKIIEISLKVIWQLFAKNAHFRNYVMTKSYWAKWESDSMILVYYRNVRWILYLSFLLIFIVKFKYQMVWNICFLFTLSFKMHLQLPQPNVKNEKHQMHLYTSSSFVILTSFLSQLLLSCSMFTETLTQLLNCKNR